MNQLERAFLECVFYNKVGGLNEDVIADIAHDYDIDYKDLLNAWNV